jgi:chromosome segregation ATPase
MQSEQVRQTEIELNQEWQAKLDKSLLQLEQKYDRQINILNQEKNDLEKQLIEAKEAMKTLKLNATKLELENESLTHKLDDLSLIKEKFERLQSQAIIMKERYENRIKELLDADPDPEIIGEEVKQVMNLIYRQLKQQIKPEQV